MNIYRHLEQGAAFQPERTAILFEESAITYGELADRSARLSASLIKMGVKRGDRVALFVPNHPAFIVSFLAAVRIGAIAVPLNPKLTAWELREVLVDSGAEIFITTAELRTAAYSSEHRLPQIRHVLIAEGDSENDLAFDEVIAAESPIAMEGLPESAPAAIVYTSGTTGHPKGVTLSHSNIDFVMRSKVEYMGVTPEDRLLLFLPLSHCFGLNAVLNAALAAGACIVLHRRFEVDEVLCSIQRNRATMFFGVPTTFILLLEKAQPDQLRPLRYFFSAAATLPCDVEERWMERFGFVVYQGYGLTESSPFATYNHISHHRRGSIGAAIRGVEIAIRDLYSSRHLPPGERGEILLRGPNVMLGYWQKPEETAAIIRDGWLHTGDIGRLDAEGYLCIEDRLKDLVIVGGANVYPAEVEQALRHHPAVLEAAVYGQPDAVLGERACACIVLRNSTSVSAEELLSFASKRLAEYKLPAQIEFLSELPKGPTGKVLKRVLRERNSVVASPDRMRPNQNGLPQILTSVRELEDHIIGWLAATLEVDRRFVTRTVPFSELGVTSLMAVELAGKLCGWLGRSVAPTIAWQFSTVESLVRYCCSENRPQKAAITVPVLTTAALSQHAIDAMSEADAVALLRDELTRVNWSGSVA